MLSSSKTETERHNYKLKWSSSSRFWKFYKAAVLVHVCQCVNASKILASHVPECEFVMISWTFMTSWLLTSQILETAGNCSFKHQKVLPHSKPLNPNCCGLYSVTKCTNTWLWTLLPGGPIWTHSQLPLLSVSILLTYDSIMPYFLLFLWFPSFHRAVILYLCQLDIWIASPWTDNVCRYAGCMGLIRPHYLKPAG